MKRFTLMMVALVLAAVARTETVGAQVLPGDGNCWTCTYLWNQYSSQYDAHCFGANPGAYSCHINYAANVCWTVGDGCTSGLFDDGGVLTETLECAALQAGEPSWWMLASGRAVTGDNRHALLTAPSSPLLAGTIGLHRAS